MPPHHDRSALALTGMLIALPPLLLGGVHTPTLFALTLLSFALAGGAVWRARSAQTSISVGPLGAAAALIGVWSALQLIPLPAALLSTLSPENAEARASLAALIDTPASGPLSLAPAPTSLATTRWLGLAAASLALGTWLRPQPRSDQTERIVALTLTTIGAVMVVIGLAQSLFGSGRHLLGFIETNSNTLGLVSGTFVNPNHAGTLIAMATLAGAGLTLDLQGRQRALAAAVTVLCATGLLLNASRGALLGFVGGGVALVAALVWLHRGAPNNDPKRVLIGVALTALPVLIAAVVAISMGWDKRLFWELAKDRTLTDLTTGNIKWQLISAALELAERFPLTGIGADAFPHVAPTALGPDAPTNRYTYVESDPPELLATLGVPAALLAMGLAGLATTRMLRPQDETNTSWSTTTLGLSAAMVAFVIHSGGSFNIFILGLALPALTIAEVLQARQRPRGWLRMPPAAATALLGALLIVALGAAWHHTGLLAQHERYQALARTPEPDPKEAQAATQSELSLLPMDGHTLSSAALLLKRAHATSDTQDAPPPSLELARLGNRLAPNSPLSYLTLARLAAASKLADEAAEGYRGYLTRQKGSKVDILPELLAAFPDAQHRAAALPPRSDLLTHTFKSLKASQRPIALLELATELQALHPDSPDAAIFAISAAFFADQPLLAELYGQQMIVNTPTHPKGYLLTARAMALQGRTDDALTLLAQGIEATGRPSVRIARAERLIRITPEQRPPNADTLIADDLKALRTETLHDPTQRAHSFYLSGLRWQQQGQPNRARRDFERAARLKPDTYTKLLKPKAP